MESMASERFAELARLVELTSDAVALCDIDGTVLHVNHQLIALVAASRRLVSEGRAQEGLWFARKALRRDGSREDAYTTLMEAQVAAGQRAAALDTYFACRRYLTEELGIDPSLDTMALYRSIIEEEDGVDF